MPDQGQHLSYPEEALYVGSPATPATAPGSTQMRQSLANSVYSQQSWAGNARQTPAMMAATPSAAPGMPVSARWSQPMSTSNLDEARKLSGDAVRRRRRRRCVLITVIVLLAIIAITAGVTIGVLKNSESKNKSGSAGSSSSSSSSSGGNSSGTSASGVATSSTGTALTATFDGSGNCQTPLVRREWRELSLDERKEYVDTINAMKKAPTSDSTLGSKNRYEDFVRVHAQYTRWAHNNPMFLIWHRWFIHSFEQALKAINPKVVLPFWDWALDSQHPAASPIFDATSGFGGNGVGDTGCIGSGPFANWWTESPASFAPHCVRRVFNGNTTITGIYSPEAMYPMVADSSNFYTFASSFEQSAHASVHNGINGDNFDLPTAPNDPLFFLHHANVDRYYYLWQLQHPTQALQYNGYWTNPVTNVSENVSTSNMVQPANVPVSQLQSTTGGHNLLCYTYSGGQTAATASNSGQGTNAVSRATTSTTAAATRKMKRRDAAAAGTPPPSNKVIATKEDLALYDGVDPNETDLSEYVKRLTAVPDEFLLKAGYDPKVTRDVEKRANAAIRKSNQDPVYVSDAALVNGNLHLGVSGVSIDGVWRFETTKIVWWENRPYVLTQNATQEESDAAMKVINEKEAQKSSAAANHSTAAPLTRPSPASSTASPSPSPSPAP